MPSSRASIRGSRCSAESLADLVGARGAGSESERGQRIYSCVTMSHGTQSWWTAERGACVGIKIADGRDKSVDAASASRCGQKAAQRGAAERQCGERLHDGR